MVPTELHPSEIEYAVQLAQACQERGRAVVHFRVNLELDQEFRALVEALGDKLGAHYEGALRAYIPVLRRLCQAKGVKSK